MEPIKVDLSTVPDAEITYSAETLYSTTTVNKPTATVINVDDTGRVSVADDGGIGEVTVTAKIGDDGKAVDASMRFINRPFYREYHKTLTMKLFMNSTYTNQAQYPDLVTFEEALELIKNLDQLTRGIPKIIYLVGWQDGGHDHQWPAWNVVDQDLAREGETGEESLNWLIREARKYNTTVSLHLNMFDVSLDSPLFEEYKERDVIARDLDGNLMPSNNGTDDVVCKYMVSYTREWQEGLTQKRIDSLFEMVPELIEGGTIHIDAFHSYWENNPTVDGKRNISPWHCKYQGIDEAQETDTQRKVFEYCREKWHVDVTSEGVGFLRTNQFIGLQPMTWWSLGELNQMEIPAQLYTGGQGNSLRYGDNLHGEDIFQGNMAAGKEATEGFFGRFALFRRYFFRTRCAGQFRHRDRQRNAGKPFRVGKRQTRLYRAV